jgi:hypothetical protein
MREIHRKAVYAYQFIPLRRGATRARHNLRVDTRERMHGFDLLPRPRLQPRMLSGLTAFRRLSTVDRPPLSEL